MTYLVVGTRVGSGWSVEVRNVGTTTAENLSDIETAARQLLADSGKADAADADLQLLLPDFEVDLDERGLPGSRRLTLPLLSGVIALVVIVGAIAYVLGRIL